MKRRNPVERGRWFAVPAVLAALVAASLACSDSTGGSVSPDDPRLQPPTANSGVKFTDFLTQLNLFPRDMIPAPWIVTPKSPVQSAAYIDMTGWGPSRLDRPWPTDPTRLPVVQIYQVQPTGCNGEVTRTLVTTAEVTDSHQWSLTLPLSQTSEIIAATVSVGGVESGLSNWIVVGESSFKPTIDPINASNTLSETLTLSGTGLPGSCVVLVDNGELNKFHDAVVEANGNWTMTTVPMNVGHVYSVRPLSIGPDSDPVTVLADYGTQSPVEQTKTGFYWPTGTSATYLKYSSTGGWLTDSCTGLDHHSVGMYITPPPQIHIGWDIAADIGDKVYAISDGRVAAIDDTSGQWGYTTIYKDKTPVPAKNWAVVVKHELKGGSVFYAIYGHVQPLGELKPDTLLTAGKPFATIGYWPYGIHLHFGIRESSDVPLQQLGARPCLQYAAQIPSGTIDSYQNPIDWIQHRYPGPLTNSP